MIPEEPGFECLFPDFPRVLVPKNPIWTLVIELIYTRNSGDDARSNREQILLYASNEIQGPASPGDLFDSGDSDNQG